MPRRILWITAVCSLVATLSSARTGIAQEIDVVGLVADRGGPSASLFRLSEGIFATIPLPDGALPTGSAVCTLTNGETIGAVGDENALVHLVDIDGEALLDSIPISIPGRDLSCCGNHLLVSHVRVPPIVVDLVRRAEVVQKDLGLPFANAIDCDPVGLRVLSANFDDEQIELLDFDPVRGQLSPSAKALQAPTTPVDVTFSRGGACGVMHRFDSTISSFEVASASLVDPSRGVPTLTIVDLCATADQLWARGGGNVWVYPQTAACELEPLLLSRPTPPPRPGLAVDSMSCAEDGLIYIAIGPELDTRTGETSPPRVDVFDPAGDRVASFLDPDLVAPISLATSRRALRRPPAIPALGKTSVALLIFALLLAAGWRLRRTRVRAR